MRACFRGLFYVLLPFLKNIVRMFGNHFLFYFYFLFFIFHSRPFLSLFYKRPKRHVLEAYFMSLDLSIINGTYLEYVTLNNRLKWIQKIQYVLIGDASTCLLFVSAQH